MSYLSDRMLRYLIRVLYALAVGVFVIAIFMPVKSLIDPKVTTRPKPVSSETPVKQNFKQYEVLPIDKTIIIGEV
jgi:hypothetical protein